MKRFDEWLSSHVHGWKLGPLDYPLVVSGMAFGSYGMPVTILVLGLWLGWKFGLIAIVAALTTIAITNPLKHMVRRPRPEPLSAARAFGIRKLVSNPAFPSGDSAQAGNIVVLLMMLGPLDFPWALLFLPLIPACMFSRVYYGAHWFGDTVAGALIGAGVAFAYAYWFEAFLRS